MAEQKVTYVRGQAPKFGMLPNNRPTPIYAPTVETQLNPIIQPIALVPYNTMNQPLWQVEQYEQVIEED